ncbi:30S ribosomal protein S8e [archaeon]|nr:30S ribosomal protein S8e [archaeon]|tara:strand:+ start:418 stop:780 length:363 start_codon:yes stop_codon:yes gene_type:complete
MKLRRKASGGRYKKQNQAKLHSRKGKARVVKLGEKKTKLVRGRGGGKKIVSLSDNMANIVVKGKSKKAAIKNVLETPANRFLARQNILVKGALIETEVGKARITNRPSQEGMIQAVLVEE